MEDAERSIPVAGRRGHDDGDAPVGRSRVFVSLAPAMLNVDQVGAFLGGISGRKIRAMVSAGAFPRPKKIDRLSRWRRSDVEAWVASLR